MINFLLLIRHQESRKLNHGGGTMNDDDILDLAEKHGWVDDFGRWNFQGDEPLLELIAELTNKIEQRWTEARS